MGRQKKEVTKTHHSGNAWAGYCYPLARADPIHCSRQRKILDSSPEKSLSWNKWKRRQPSVGTTQCNDDMAKLFCRYTLKLKPWLLAAEWQLSKVGATSWQLLLLSATLSGLSTTLCAATASQCSEPLEWWSAHTRPSTRMPSPPDPLRTSSAPTFGSGAQRATWWLWQQDAFQAKLGKNRRKLEWSVFELRWRILIGAQRQSREGAPILRGNGRPSSANLFKLRNPGTY